ncbi:MAG: hypothetical protein V4850_24810 [Myxococcota bacterium]
MSLPHIAAIVASVVLALVMVFQLLLAAGLPFGRAAWGGAHRVLPTRLRVGSVLSAVVLGGAAWVVLARAGLVGVDSVWVRAATWVFTGLFALNTLGNLASKSAAERYGMTPVTVVLVGCFGVVAVFGG